nr:universal stress protein [Streptacidiphilus neutrinimicus]
MDGSETAAAAAHWAGAMAEASGDVVRLLHVRPRLDQSPGPVRSRQLDIELQAMNEMARTADQLRRTHPGLSVDTAVEEGGVANVLCRAADRVGTLVLGTRGAGPAALVLGSVALAVASRSDSPVVLVPPGAAETPLDREVVVGVDLKGDGGPVLTYGFEQAKRLGVGLRAVHVWRPPTPLSAAVHVGAEPHRLEGKDRVLSTELAAVQAFFSDVEAVSQEIRGVPTQELPPITDKASLLVLGRRRARPRPAVLGPVVPVVVGRAACPIAVVPHQ